MRLRGLDTRRLNSAKRLWRRDEPKEWVLREKRLGVYEQVAVESSGERTDRAGQAQVVGPGPSQPPGSDGSKPNLAAEAKPAHTHAAPAPVAQAGGVVCYGYELSPGVWVDAKPPVRNPNGLTEAAVLRARRMFPRRWDGK